MHTNYFKAILTSTARVLAILSFATAAHAQATSQVNLTAAPTSTTMPDGTVVPMWGYFCGMAATGATSTCAALNPASVGNPTAVPPVPGTWSPVIITVPVATTGATSLTINLTNNLSFTPTGATTANAIPTSIVIVGQVGGGLGNAALRTTTVSPSHSTAQECPTWFIAANPPGTPCTAPTPNVTTNTPPTQANRVQSFSTEVEAVAAGTAATCSAVTTGTANGCATLTWSNLKPGTYLLESGTHPSIQVPMGLIGVLVVTTAPTSATTAGTAYPGAAATATNAAIPAVMYNAEIPLEFSEIDPVQNTAVAAAVATSGFNEANVWSGLFGGCGNPLNANGTSNAVGATTVGPTPFGTCYPPAVNYTPFYYLINGVAFNKNKAAGSLFAATPGTTAAPTTGTVLARLVNAGLRMHVPSIVGSLTQGFDGAGAPATVSGFTLIAEDGNVIPGVQVAGTASAPSAPRVQTDVFMAAGKVFDVMFNVPAAPAAGSTSTALSIFARDLGLSGDSSTRDAGMIAYIGVNSAGLPAVSTGAGGSFAPAAANNDTYNSLVAGQPFSVSDVSKGVIANDVNVYGVTLLAAPTGGSLTCNAQPQRPVGGLCRNGTFTYTPNAGTTSDTFTYCANGSVTGTTCSSGLTATVFLNASTLAGGPTAITQSYTAKTASYFKLPSPGLLVGNSDPNKLPLSVVTTGAAVAGLTLDSQGGFTVLNPTPTAANTFTFNYTVQNSQGRTSAAGTATVTFPAPSNLQVHVVDAAEYQANACNATSTVGTTGITCGTTTVPFITDYRWIIEEDKTFWVDPNCTANTSTTTPGCAAVVGPAGTTTIPTFGTNFHASHMDFVAQGCTGSLSCESGQTMLDTRTGSATLGQHIPAVCDLGNGACRPDPNCTALPCITSGGTTAVLPSSVKLDPAKRYYISILPGDAGNPFNPAYLGPPTGCDTPVVNGQLNNTCGHTMGGAPIPPACNILVAAGGANACTATSAFAAVTVTVLPTPLPVGKLSVVVFEDDFPLNGEQDGGGGTGTGVVAPLEPGLGGFNLVLWDTYGGLGDVTGQDTYDMFNQPLTNSLAGTIDPSTGMDACPLTANPLVVTTGAGSSQTTSAPNNTGGITGMIVTCPKYESDGTTLSPLAGQAVIANLMPEKFSVQAYPGADRIARGEEWLQTNTLDGQHPHDSFIRIGEPSYFQEFGPGGYHVSIGFANPAIINARQGAVCNGDFGSVGPCTNTITGSVDVQRISRTPDQRLYPSGSRDAFAWTQCWVSLGDPDAEDFMFTKCDANGNFQFTNVPGGQWRLTIGDQWNDQIIDGLSTPANVGCTSTAPNQTNNASTCPGGQTLALGNIGVQQWQSNLYTRIFVDDNKNGIFDGAEIGVPQVYTHIRYRDGHNSNTLLSDPNGIANFNETFPLFNWYVVEPDTTRYKRTGTHVVYDAGGPADGSTYCGTGSATSARQCGTPATTTYNFLANTHESIPLPSDLSVPGAVYCAKADCTAEANSNFRLGTARPSFAAASTGRIDPPWVSTEGWSGMTSQGNWIEFGVAPYAECDPSTAASATNFCATVTTTAPGATTATTRLVGENGGIHGFVDYASTRPFDTAEQMIEQPWEPYVPHVTINLYQEGFAADGVTPTLTMVDTTQTSSWDDWAQGFYPSSTAGGTAGAGQKPYMSCPGQGVAPVTSGTQPPNADPFYFSLFDQPEYLDLYNSQHNGGTLHTLPYHSQYKCYDSMHIWNQIQPAPYDGMYQFPSSLGINATTGKLLATKGSTNGVASSMNGTNCTVCVANPDTTDVYRKGTPMLPPGKYVVEVIMPPGFEVYKEEDKNLLIGDNYIAPVAQEFAGLGGSIFILPDQASVASPYEPSGAGFNPSNYQNSTTGLGLNAELSGVPGFPGYQNPLWPCVGEMRTVPDYLSLFPHALETAPFAGATRPLCDRKEVTLGDQMNVRNNFFIFTSAHVASKFTGVITNDFTSEFDPFSPQFGEKFSPPNMPVSTRDYLGNEVSRVYADHWGTYESLVYSTWEVNPPNITGYSPNMMVQCMNDAGPILDTRARIPDPNNPGATIANPTLGQMIPDPLYNPAYSQFCYEEPYMPGLTTYLDTPVVPTQAFVGAAYNDVDCAYPDTTPAISEVDGDGIGPWVSGATGHRTLTITALGNVQVNNSAYAGPSASVAPFNLKKVQRHYGFGATKGAVAIGTYSVPAGNITTWTDTSIVLTIPTNANIPACSIQQQAQYGGSAAQCGQLVITTANTATTGPSNAKQSIDAVTVTIGGKGPVHVSPSQTIQSAIDQAAPGDLIIVDPTCTTTAGLAAACTTPSATNIHNPASHNEMVIMWKPVRLQGAGAASAIINANTSPAGKLLDPWRRHVNCLFGLALNGTPYSTSNAYDPSRTYNCPDADSGNTWLYFGTDLTGTGLGTSVPNNPQIDRLPLEAILGWDANLNGNIAELLQEPTLMGAYEGAGITVLAKGLEFHGQVPWNDGTEGGAFPTVTTLLMGVVSQPGSTGGTTGLQVGDANQYCHTVTYNTNGTVTQTSDTNPYPSNFMCNPSSIDGLSVTNSSQGGGGIFVHGWAHYLQIANNRVTNNAGTLTGGISVGQGEFGGPYIVGDATNAAPGSCSDGTGLVTNQHLPDCFQVHANVHNNMITSNASLGDELFSGTLSGGGGATFCTGNDYYKFNYNWVCGNVSAGEGGGMVHLGEIQNGDIEHDSFLLNQSINPTIPTNGGGIMVQGTPDTDPTCPGVPDSDCPPGLSDGTGRNLVINANLIQGNSADSGAGGGIRMNQVNGTDVATFANHPEHWNSVLITNNIIVNNVAGWDGAGISLQDALNVSIVNNTIAHNDTLASSGVLTNGIGTPQASAPSSNCTNAAGTASCAQPAGVSSTPNSALLSSSFPVPPAAPITCPAGQTGTTGSNCRAISNPVLANNIIWQNRAFDIGITVPGTGTLNQQNLVALFNGGTSTQAPAQTATGQCSTGATYWDIGVRGNTGPGNHTGGTLHPTFSVLSSGGYAGSNNNSGTTPPVISQYCNGSRVPPECSVADGCGGPSGFGVPPGINDAVTPNPRFSLTPAATVDEGNNWINVSWGPLALANPAVLGPANPGATGGDYGGGPALANYSLSAGIGGVPASQDYPPMDFFGNARSGNNTDPGAVEFAGPVGIARVSPTTLTFGNQTRGTTSSAMTVTVANTGTVALAGGSFTFGGGTPQPFSRPAGTAGGTCGATLAVGASCTVNVVFAPAATTTSGTAFSRRLTVAYSGGAAVTGSPVTLTGTAQ